MTNTDSQTGFTYDAEATTIELLITLALCVPSGVLIVLIYSYIRKNHPSLFEIRRKYESRVNNLEYPSFSNDSLFKWLYESWTMDTATFLKYAGIDALCFRIYLTGCLYICLACIPYSLIVLIPIYASADPTNKTDDVLLILSIDHIPKESGLLWFPVIGIYLFISIALYFLAKVYLVVSYISDQSFVGNVDNWFQITQQTPRTPVLKSSTRKNSNTNDRFGIKNINNKNNKNNKNNNSTNNHKKKRMKIENRIEYNHESKQSLKAIDNLDWLNYSKMGEISAELHYTQCMQDYEQSVQHVGSLRKQQTGLYHNYCKKRRLSAVIDKKAKLQLEILSSPNISTPIRNHNVVSPLINGLSEPVTTPVAGPTNSTRVIAGVMDTDIGDNIDNTTDTNNNNDNTSSSPGGGYKKLPRRKSSNLSVSGVSFGNQSEFITTSEEQAVIKRVQRVEVDKYTVIIRNVPKVFNNEKKLGLFLERIYGSDKIIKIFRTYNCDKLFSLSKEITKHEKSIEKIENTHGFVIDYDFANDSDIEDEKSKKNKKNKKKKRKNKKKKSQSNLRIEEVDNIANKKENITASTNEEKTKLKTDREIDTTDGENSKNKQNSDETSDLNHNNEGQNNNMIDDDSDSEYDEFEDIDIESSDEFDTSSDLEDKNENGENENIRMESIVVDGTNENDVKSNENGNSEDEEKERKSETDAILGRNKSVESNYPLILDRIHFWNFMEEKIDIINYHIDSLKRLKREFRKEKEIMIKKKRTPCTVFVTFSDLQSASDCILNPIRFGLIPLKIEKAPLPGDIHWNHLKYRSKDLRRFRLLSFALLILLLIFWTIPVALVQVIANLEYNLDVVFNYNMSKYYSDEVIATMEGMLSILILTIWLKVLPGICKGIAKLGKNISKGHDEVIIMQIYYLCLIVMVLFVTVLSGVFWGNYNEGEFNNIRDTFELIARALSEMSTYFLQYLVLYAFVYLPIAFFRPSFWTKTFFHVSIPTRFNYAKWYGKTMLMLLICLTYSVFSPIVWIVGSIFYFFAIVLFTYVLSMDFFPEFEISGMMWPRVFRALTLSFQIPIIETIGLLILKEAWYQAIACGPLIVITPVISRFVDKKFETLFDAASVVRANDKDRLLSKANKQLAQVWNKKDERYYYPSFFNHFSELRV